jgi:hypothetical protein
MINFNFTLQNPFKYSDFKYLFQKDYKLSENKTLELELFSYRNNLFMLNLDLRWFGYDHAGPEFRISILGYEFSVVVYDRRHWDINKNKWEKYENTNCQTDH